MTFDESERSDFPPPNWIDKEPKEEEIARETRGFTTESLEETRSIFDPGRNTVRSETRVGICSFCLKVLDERNSLQCYYGGQICAKCSFSYNGRPVCRMHVETNIGDKVDAIVLSGISAKINKEELKKLSGIPIDVLEAAKIRLLSRRCITSGGFGLLGKFPKLTPKGIECLNTMRTAYENDLDFSLFLDRLRRFNSVGSAAQ